VDSPPSHSLAARNTIGQPWPYRSGLPGPLIGGLPRPRTGAVSSSCVLCPFGATPASLQTGGLFGPSCHFLMPFHLTAPLSASFPPDSAVSFSSRHVGGGTPCSIPVVTYLSILPALIGDLPSALLLQLCASVDGWAALPFYTLSTHTLCFSSGRLGPCCGSCPTYRPHVWPYVYPIQFTPCSSCLGGFIGTTLWNCLLLGSPLRVFPCMDILDFTSLREGCCVAGGAEGASVLG
jgi:hypothetical protein